MLLITQPIEEHNPVYSVFYFQCHRETRQSASGSLCVHWILIILSQGFLCRSWLRFWLSCPMNFVSFFLLNVQIICTHSSDHSVELIWVTQGWRRVFGVAVKPVQCPSCVPLACNISSVNVTADYSNIRRLVTSQHCQSGARRKKVLEGSWNWGLYRIW